MASVVFAFACAIPLWTRRKPASLGPCRGPRQTSPGLRVGCGFLAVGLPSRARSITAGARGSLPASLLPRGVRPQGERPEASAPLPGLPRGHGGAQGHGRLAYGKRGCSDSDLTGLGKFSVERAFRPGGRANIWSLSSPSPASHPPGGPTVSRFLSMPPGWALAASVSPPSAEPFAASLPPPASAPGPDGNFPVAFCGLGPALCRPALAGALCAADIPSEAWSSVAARAVVTGGLGEAASAAQQRPSPRPSLVPVRPRVRVQGPEAGTWSRNEAPAASAGFVETPSRLLAALHGERSAPPQTRPLSSHPTRFCSLVTSGAPWLLLTAIPRGASPLRGCYRDSPGGCGRGVAGLSSWLDGALRRATLQVAGVLVIGRAWLSLSQAPSPRRTGRSRPAAWPHEPKQGHQRKGTRRWPLSAQKAVCVRGALADSPAV